MEGKISGHVTCLPDTALTGGMVAQVHPVEAVRVDSHPHRSARETAAALNPVPAMGSPASGKRAHLPVAVRVLLMVGGATKAEVATTADTCSTRALEGMKDRRMGRVDVMIDPQVVGVHQTPLWIDSVAAATKIQMVLDRQCHCCDV